MNYTLKENNAGGMLLTACEEDEVLMLTSFEAEEMSEYLHAVRNGMLVDSLRDMATCSAYVDEDDHETYRAEWKDCPVIADNDGMYRDRAGVAGEHSLQLCGLRENALAELERCETADEVRDIVVSFPETVTADVEDDWRRHEFAWKVCRLIYDKIQPKTFAEIQQMVQHWDAVCSELICSEYISLEPFFNNGEEFQPSSFEEANIVEMTCSRVDLRGFRPYDLSSDMARFCSGEVLEWVDSDQDGDVRWFYFQKK